MGNVMNVTIRYNQPIGNFKAVERTETFRAVGMWATPGTSLIYFKTDRFNVRSVAREKIVSIENN